MTISTADVDLVAHAAATNVALRQLADALGYSLTGLPEPQRTYARAASLEDLANYHRATQVAFDQVTGFLQQVADTLAEVLARPPIVIEVPVPEVNVAAHIVVPESPAQLTFRRDSDGRIIGATKVPTP